MKIDINQISPEGLTLEEDIKSSEWDIETDIIKFPQTLKVKLDAYRITNTVTAQINLNTLMLSYCSRCLNEIRFDFKKNLKLSYPINKLSKVIDLNPDIREEIILEYPLQPLCKPDCKGLCPKCGKNLNEEKCNCVY